MKQWQRREQWLKSLKATDMIPYEPRAEPGHIGDVLSVAVVLALWIVVFTN